MLKESGLTNHPLHVVVEGVLGLGGSSSLTDRVVSRRMADRSLANRVVSIWTWFMGSMVAVSKCVAHFAFLCARPLFLKVGSRLRDFRRAIQYEVIKIWICCFWHIVFLCHLNLISLEKLNRFCSPVCCHIIVWGTRLASKTSSQQDSIITCAV